MEQSRVDDTLSSKPDFSPENLPIDKQVPSFSFYRDGKIIKTYKIAGSNDPEFWKEAQAEGYFTMSGSEFVEQAKLMKLRTLTKGAENPDQKELAAFRIGKSRQDLDRFAPPKGDTLRIILPKMHPQNKPLETTKGGHHRTIEEFISLHSDLPLIGITKQHISGCVEYLATVRNKNRPLAPTTIGQRMDKLFAILLFATTVDAVRYDVGKTVRAPKDTRPLGDQTFKPFTKLEIRKLIDVATDVWTNRALGNKTRSFWYEIARYKPH